MDSPADGITQGRIKASRYNDHAGQVLIRDWQDDVHEGRKVIAISHARTWPRNVDGVACARTVADFARLPCARIEVASADSQNIELLLSGASASLQMLSHSCHMVAVDTRKNSPIY